MQARVWDIFRDSAAVKLRFVEEHAARIADLARRMADVLRNGGKLLFAGNGGSAADAQHLAAEFVNRFQRDRRAFAAIALTTDTSILTSIGNDSGYEHVFSRQIEALGRPGDLLVAISTSGNSPSILSAVAAARQAGMGTVALTGGSGGRLAAAADQAFIVPSATTARIQETHITLGHAICALVEDLVAESGSAKVPSGRA